MTLDQIDFMDDRDEIIRDEHGNVIIIVKHK